MFCKVFWISQDKSIGIHSHIYTQLFLNLDLYYTEEAKTYLENSDYNREEQNICKTEIKTMFIFKTNMDLFQACFAKALFNSTLKCSFKKNIHAGTFLQSNLSPWKSK